MNGPSHVLRPGCEEKPPDSPMCSYHFSDNPGAISFCLNLEFHAKIAK